MNAYNTLFCSSSLALSAADISEVALRNFFSVELLSIDGREKKNKCQVLICLSASLPNNLIGIHTDSHIMVRLL